jgi:hypothetical protein
MHDDSRKDTLSPPLSRKREREQTESASRATLRAAPATEIVSTRSAFEMKGLLAHAMAQRRCFNHHLTRAVLISSKISGTCTAR